jgi:hypothetical protein
MKQRRVTWRVTCKTCGTRLDYDPILGGRPPEYCDVCRAERKREQARARMAALRARRP